MKKIITEAYYNPLVIFLLSIIYGLLRIDFSETAVRVAYGWYYIFIGTFIFYLLYLIAAVRVLHFTYLTVNNNRGNLSVLHGLLILFTLTSLISFLARPTEVIFALYSLSSFSGIVFAISVVALAFTGYLLSRKKNPRLS